MKTEKQIVQHRKHSLDYYYRNEEKRKEYNRKWKRENLSKCKDIANKQYKRNKKNILSRSKGHYYIKIPKGQICQFRTCKKLAKERHHEDYDKPLVISFYCVEHHHFIHRRIKR